MSKQERFNQCLTDMKTILDKAGISFFLVCGTLLGAHRDGKFIEHDEDIDIGILSSDFNSTVKDDIQKSGLFRMRIRGDVSRSLHFTNIHKNGTVIDIFLFYSMDSPEKYYHATFDGVCKSKPGGFCKLMNHLRGFTQTVFMGNTYMIPTNTEEILLESYGEDWRIPKKMTYSEGLKGGFKNIE